MFFAFWLPAQGRQWLLRRRAERLLADIKGLDLNRSSWSDAQILISRWGKWGHWEGACDATSCQYEIRLNDRLFDSPQFIYEDGLHLGARLLDHVGLRSAAVSAEFHVSNGVVTTKGFGVDVALPFRLWGVPNGIYWPELKASFSEAATLRESNPHLRASQPHHSIFLRRIDLRANFTPEESLKEQSALMAFHLDCLTRWSSCLSLGDLAPRANEEFEAERKEWKDAERTDKETEQDNRYTPTCFPTVIDCAREEPNVLVGDLVRVNREPDSRYADPKPAVWVLDVHLLRVLKGQVPVPTNSIVTVYVPHETGSATTGESWPFKSMVIMGATRERWGTHDLVVYSGDCGTVEASPENLSEARQGVGEDFGRRN